MGRVRAYWVNLGVNIQDWSVSALREKNKFTKKKITIFRIYEKYTHETLFVNRFFGIEIFLVMLVSVVNSDLRRKILSLWKSAKLRANLFLAKKFM